MSMIHVICNFQYQVIFPAYRFAFKNTIYHEKYKQSRNKTVSLQSISSNLKETMNPKDIMTDAVHNFHPTYQQYTQQGM